MPIDPKMSNLGGGPRKFLARNVMERLSSDIVENQSVRKEFMSDPEKFIKQKYGAALSVSEKEFIKNLQEIMADGFCCNGCGCSGGNFGKDFINPAIKK